MHCGESPNLDPLALESLVRSFVDVLTAVAGTDARKGGSNLESRDDALRLIVRQYIRTAVPSGRVSADAAAREASIWTRSMHRLFQPVGTTFSDIVRDERLNGAMLDIGKADNSVTLSAIAARWGFYDSSHLTRTFRQQLDCTPNEFRAKHNAGATPTAAGDLIGRKRTDFAT